MLLPAALLVLASIACGGCGSSREVAGGRAKGEGAPAAAARVADRGTYAAWPAEGAAVVEADMGGSERFDAGVLVVWTPLLPGGPAGEASAGEEGVESGPRGGRTPRAGTRPDAEDLALQLAIAAEALAPLVPIPLEDLRRQPLEVVVERDHVQQILHAGEVGEAVLGPAGPAGGTAAEATAEEGAADVHLVLHPDDGFAYHHALAQALMRRAGVGQDLPPYLRSGAAWWLVEEASLPGLSSHLLAASVGGASWYGRPRADWLRRLAAAAVLPTADELLAAEEPPDGSRLLWTPVAAKVVAALPGTTLAQKLAAGAEGGGEGGQGSPGEERGSVPPLRGLVESVLAELTTSAELPRRRVPGEAREPLSVPGGTTASTPREPLPPFLAGVSLAMLNDIHLGYQAPSVDRALVHLRDHLGANAVSLMPFAYQRRPGEPRLVFLNRRPRSETDAAMIHAGRRADERGLVVLWKPQIWLSGSWPGEVEMATEEDWEAWFRGYRRFLVHQAVLADRVGAEVFSVGVELGRTVDRRADWERVIDAVGLFYDGALTYSANWYGDFDRVPFWDRLDFLGMDAYQPLTEDPAAGDAALAAGARRVVAELEAAAGTHGKPLLLTEMGFAAHEAAWVAPHEEGGPFSPRDQARAYRALLDALGHPQWLRGVFVWKAFSSGPADGPGSEERRREGRRDEDDLADFRFLGRPAEALLADYFRAAP